MVQYHGTKEFIDESTRSRTYTNLGEEQKRFLEEYIRIMESQGLLIPKRDKDKSGFCPIGC